MGPIPNFWQIAGGPSGRSYATVFIRHGVGLIGPGDAGAWKEGRPDKDFGGSSSVRCFATRAQPGDIVLLRSGNSVVKAVGLIASNYQHVPAFDDVNGWDLQHARRIRWRPLPQDHDFGQTVFGANPRRFGKVNHVQVVDFARRFVSSPPTDWQTAALPTLPPEEELLDDIPEVLRDLVGQAHDYAMMAYSRVDAPEYPSEHEIVGHFVIPFLRALGWTIERIAVEWRRMDVAIFQALPRVPENCHLVIEAKRFGAGVEGAFDQARAYVEKLGVIRDVVVTDGVRYRLYSASQGFAPVAYANLSRLKRSALDLFNRLKRP